MGPKAYFVLAHSTERKIKVHFRCTGSTAEIPGICCISSQSLSTSSALKTSASSMAGRAIRGSDVSDRAGSSVVPSLIDVGKPGGPASAASAPRDCPPLLNSKLLSPQRPGGWFVV